MTDTMGHMHSDAQFAGSSSVPAHVEMELHPLDNAYTEHTKQNKAAGYQRLYFVLLLKLMEFSHYPPKLSYMMLSGSTPKPSSMFTTALDIGPGPHM